MNWQEAVNWCHDNGNAFTLVTLISTSGSTPRGGSTKMVVTQNDIHDTIGGGELEFKVTAHAREMLVNRVPQQKVEHFPLATKANQCCGGSVTVLLESFPVTGTRVAIFGAGHVAASLIKILAHCDARIDWVDTRPEIFPEELPANVKPRAIDDPVDFIESLSNEHRCVVMTHDHQLDYRLVYSLLSFTEVDYVGMIGSETKARRFYARMTKDGINKVDQLRCVCPVGLKEIKGKLPMEIAVSVAGQLLSLDPVRASELKPALSWKEVRAAFSSPPPVARPK